MSPVRRPVRRPGGVLIGGRCCGGPTQRHRARGGATIRAGPLDAAVPVQASCLFMPVTQPMDRTFKAQLIETTFTAATLCRGQDVVVSLGI